MHPDRTSAHRPGNKSLAGLLLRLILAGVLFALGLLVAYWAQVASPYDPGAFVQLRDAAAAYAVLNMVYVWKVKTAMRYVAAFALAIAALSFAEYAWQFYF